MLVAVICLLLSGDIHPCPGPDGQCHSPMPGDGMAFHGTTSRSNNAFPQVRTSISIPATFDHEQTNLIRRFRHPNAVELPEAIRPDEPLLAGPMPELSAGESGERRHAEDLVVFWCAPGRHTEDGRPLTTDSTNTDLQTNYSATASNNDSGTLEHSAEPNPTLKVCLDNKTRVAVRNVNKPTRKLINPAITKKRDWSIFQTVNNARVVWDPKAKPKGLLGGHLNIHSIKSKSDQIQHLLNESNLHFLCLSETWLHEHAPSAAVSVPGYVQSRRDRVGSKRGGVS